jgi:hypothetical protein
MKKTLALVGAAVAGLSLAAVPAVHAQDVEYTPKMVADRMEIDDLLERYYANFGKAEGESFSKFYADDAEFVLGDKTYKGKEAIAGVYKGVGASGQNPAANRFSFNVLLTNKVITLHGDTATAQMIFTEVIKKTAADPPEFLTQGREYDRLAKIKGHWRFTRRQVAGPKPLEGWVN